MEARVTKVARVRHDRSPLLAFLRRRLRNPLSLIAPLHLPPGLLDSPRTTRRAKDYSNPRLFGPLTASLERIRSEMNRSKNADFAERLTIRPDQAEQGAASRVVPQPFAAPSPQT